MQLTWVQALNSPPTNHQQTFSRRQKISILRTLPASVWLSDALPCHSCAEVLTVRLAHNCSSMRKFRLRHSGLLGPPRKFFSTTTWSMIHPEIIIIIIRWRNKISPPKINSDVPILNFTLTTDLLHLNFSMFL